MPDSQQDTNGNKSSQKQSGNAKSAKSGTHLQEHDRELKELIHAARDSEAQAIMLADLEKAARKSADGRAYEEATTAHFQLSIMQQLSDCIFVGHINTDLDSVAGAIGAACLFGGTPAISEENLNGEILFALKTCGIETPQLFDSIHGSQSGPQSKPICLVDHSEEKQMVASLRNCPDRGVRIQGIIDHHAVAASFTTGIPVFVDMRPWGSMSSIIAILFITYKKHLPKPLAKLLLMAILSDTLDLRSVTTTDADCEIVTLLCRYAGVGDHDALASEQFQAKTDWIVNLGAYEMTRGDQKDFTAGDWKFGIAVLEVTTPDPVLKIAAQIMCELRLLKKEKGNTNYKESKLRKKSQELDFAFLFVVDIINQDSKMIICGGRELALAKAAFPKGSLQEAVQGIKPVGNTIAADETCMYLPGMVSRKKQFAPAFHAALNDAFECSKGPNATTEKDSLVRDTVSTLSGPVAAQSVQLQRSQQLRRTLKEISPAQLQEEKLLAAESLTVDTYHDSVRVHGRPYEKDAKKKDLRATLKALPQINEIHNYSNSSSTLSKSGYGLPPDHLEYFPLSEGRKPHDPQRLDTPQDFLAVVRGLISEYKEKVEQYQKKYVFHGENLNLETLKLDLEQAVLNMTGECRRLLSRREHPRLNGNCQQCPRLDLSDPAILPPGKRDKRRRHGLGRRRRNRGCLDDDDLEGDLEGDLDLDLCSENSDSL